MKAFSIAGPLLLGMAAALGAQTAQPVATAPATATNRWIADPVHSAVTFRVRHLGISWVNGTFGQWSAEFTYDPGKPEGASVTARIQAASITTGNERRDNDLRHNYLAVDSFPEITFTSTKVERTAPDHLRISGNLTIHGITRPAVLETDVGGVADTPGGRRTAFSATTTIKRQDFSIVRNPFLEGTQMVGDDVRITIDVEVKETATP
jgi:polyisoprenoid-binding protein YceI